MTPEEYSAQQAVISAAIARYVMSLGELFQEPQVNVSQWVRLLELLFPEIKRQREQASELARRFYDSQRALYFPGVHRRPLEDYKFEWFVEAMEPSRRRFSQKDAPDHAVGDLARRVVKEVENGGRRQIIRAVETDHTVPVRGWARVATGRETCAWCLMLISRGPIYMGADTAGLDLDDTTAQRMIAAGEDVSEYMTQWHAGCDCKVVPVFSYKQWHGKEAAGQALKLWNEATREANTLWDSMSSSEREKTTLNREAINALRRRLERGEIDPREFAGIAA
ncbi:hypothetical protein N806_31225 [Rhodococcus sp. P27]|nr:hypothetical protein N806_31225 [Rhodococcus sp. P27]